MICKKTETAREIWGIIEEEGEVKVCHVIVSCLCLSYSYECGGHALDVNVTPYEALLALSMTFRQRYGISAVPAVRGT